jgi:starch phosphorylase
MAENYNVTYAGKIIPAAEISEQISLASKEASGTSNMKFMLNGAVTLGTEDGANVEIRDLVGNDNIYIFGKKKDEVIRLYAESGYHPDEYYKDPEIKKLIDFITGPEMNGKMAEIGKTLRDLHHELISKDWFMTLLDVKDYIETKEKVYSDYEDRKAGTERLLSIFPRQVSSRQTVLLNSIIMTYGI